MKTIKKALKKAFHKGNERLRTLAEKNSLMLKVYDKLFLPVVCSLFRAGNYRLGRIIAGAYVTEMYEELKKSLPESLKKDGRKRRRLERDIIKSYFTGNFFPPEYFLYHFQDLDYWERKEFLSDYDRAFQLLANIDDEIFEIAQNKALLYEKARPYFHREMCQVSPHVPVELFVDFVRRHQRFFVKPFNGATGRGTSIMSANNDDEAKKLFQQLSNNGSWVVEELIKQHPATAQWNESSVNTLRVPTFRTSDGCRILQPFFRTGRKGSIIDNAGQGGVFAVFDPDTGIITTDGVDEYGGTYPTHPDSGLKFKGWQIPQYDQVKKLAAELIHFITGTTRQKYLAFDFALTDEGWILVEANSLGQFVGQMAEQKGVRKKVLQYIKG